MVHVGVEWLGIVMYHMSDIYTSQESNFGDQDQSKTHFFQHFYRFSVCLRRGFRLTVERPQSCIFFRIGSVFLGICVP